MFRAFWASSARRSMSGGSATGPASELAQLDRPRPARHRPVVERCRLRGRKAVLAGLNSSQAGAASSRGAPAVFFVRREPAMTTLRFDDLRQYSDVLRSRQRRGGHRALCRAARRRGAAELFPLAVGALPLQPFPRRDAANCRRRCSSDFIHVGEADRFHRGRDHDGRRLRDHRRRSALRLPPRRREPRVRPVDRRPLAGPRHRHGAVEESRMPRGRVRRRRACSATRCAPTRA